MAKTPQPKKAAAPKRPPPARTIGEQRLGITYKVGNNSPLQNVQERAGRLIDQIDVQIPVPPAIAINSSAPRDKRRVDAWSARVMLEQEIRENVNRARNAAFSAIEKAMLCMERAERELTRLPK